MSQVKHKKKYFIVIICMLLQGIPFCVAQNIQPLFIPYVIKAFGFSLAGFSLLFTIGAIASAVFAPFLGKLFGKVPIKVLFIVGITLASLGFLGFGFARTLPAFYILSAICQIGTVLFSGLGVPYVVSAWFPDQGRGRALGLAFAGGAIGNIFMQQLTALMLDRLGASSSYFIFGLLALVISLPIVLFFVRLPKPEEIEGVDEHIQKITKDLHEYEGLGFKATTHNLNFWRFEIGYAVIGISISAMSTQYATYFTSGLGLKSAVVGGLGSLFALFCLLGNVGGGVLFDKLGTFKTMSLSLGLSVIALSALLISSRIPSLAFVFSIAYGLDVFSYMSAPAFMATDIFGKKDSSVILGTISLSFAVGFAAGSTLFGLIADQFGFVVAWAVMLGCTVIGYILMLSAIHKLNDQLHSDHTSHGTKS